MPVFSLHALFSPHGNARADIISHQRCVARLNLALIHHNTFQFRGSLDHSAGIAGVADIADHIQTSFEKAKTWVRELQRQADPGIVIMLVGNKLDLSASRKTSTELGKQFADEEGLLFAEASAKSGEGVEGLFMEIG